MDELAYLLGLIIGAVVVIFAEAGLLLLGIFLIAGLFSLPVLTFWQCVGIVILIKLLLLPFKK